MNTIIKREALLTPLQQVIGAVERRQTLPILGNVLLKSTGGDVSLSATDLEIEVIATVDAQSESDFQTTIPARKLLDICKALPDSSEIKLTIDENRVTLVAGKSRFTMSSLPANDFPTLDEVTVTASFTVPQQALKDLLDQTSFAMAQQDVRYYLNGILMEVDNQQMKLVATDGHRLAMSTWKTETGLDDERQVIIPRKAVMEIARLLSGGETDVEVSLSQNHIRIQTGGIVFTSKLIDGKFPDYNRVIPVDGNKTMEVDRDLLKQAMSRISILSNEKYRGIRLVLDTDNLLIQANNPDQEEAEEEVAVSYPESALEIGFNVTYLIDVLNVLESEKVQLKFKDSNSSCIIQSSEGSGSLYVVMPMRL